MQPPGFPIGFRVEVDPEFPGDGGEPPERIPSDLVRIGAILRITPLEGDPWSIAIGQAGWARTPNPRHIAVISDYHGFVLDVVSHEVVAEVFQCIRITEDERHGLVLIVTFTDITAVGFDRIEWTTQRLALDDLKVVSINEDAIVCSGYFGYEPHEELTIDPRDGRLLSGPNAEDMFRF